MSNTESNEKVTNAEKLLVSVADAATYLSVCTRTVYNLAKTGELASKRIGSRLLIKRTSLLGFVKK